MAYPYLGPELSIYAKYKFRIEQERDKYARRAKRDATWAMGSGAVVGLSAAFGWALALSMVSNGVESFSTSLPDPRAIGLCLWAFSIPAGLVAGGISTVSWMHNEKVVKEKNDELASVSEWIKEVEKGVLQ